MDLLIEEALKELKKENNRKLTLKDKKRIHNNFPIPKDHKILWIDNVENNYKYGMVITDIGIFFRASPSIVKQVNENVSKKNKVNYIYHYFKWEYFNLEDFKLKKNLENKYDVIFNGKKILEINRKSNFFKSYSNAYNKFIKEASVSSENIFANLEAITSENFSKVNSNHGHGEMAEEVLTLLDKMQGKNAEVIGRNNKKDGADRIVEGIEIQTKYYSSGKKCIDACFDKTTGKFRYQNSKGELMLIEVPKNKYVEAIDEFRKKILEGKVPEVTNPDDASKYIKKGQLDYEQALNLCKPGTIESLKYDATTGAINCSFTFGITFLSTFIFAYSKNRNTKEALNSAFSSGIQVFGTSFFAYVLSEQVARTELTKKLVPLSTYIVKKMGNKTAQTIVSSIRSMSGKTAISGATATRQLSKMIRSNIITATATFCVFSIPDTYNIFKKKISKAQYVKNMISLVGTMQVAGASTIGAKVAMTKLGMTVGGPVGATAALGSGVVGGLVGGKALKAVGDYIKEDDTVIMSRLFNVIVVNLIYEYMLSESEIELLIKKLDEIKPEEFKEIFETVIRLDKQEKFIEYYLRHYFEDIIRKRKIAYEPKPEDFVEFFRQFEDNKS